MIDTILTGDAWQLARTLPDASIHCVITSPPYWGLRDYGTAQWDGGDPACDHLLSNTVRTAWANDVPGPNGIGKNTRAGHWKPKEVGGECAKCGARRVDSQLGLELTPGAYVERLVGLFAELRRALRPDGTVWLNLGDSYNGSGGAGGDYGPGGLRDGQPKYPGRNVAALKPKDLIGIPWRVAFALQADGWFLRSDTIWHKPNAMPESVRDRPTRAHEYLFLLAKSGRYHYEPGPGMVRRSVWKIATKPYRGAHFAVMPPKLIEPCILAGCPPGGIVCDPFMGSGTVAAVAREWGRHFIGFELNPDYVALAHERLAAVQPRLLTEMAGVR